MTDTPTTVQATPATTGAALEAITATLREHLDGPCSICDHDQPGHLAGDVARAIRGLSPDLQAELIGGEVERGVRAEAGGATLAPVTRWDNPTRIDGVQMARLVGPWMPRRNQ